MRPAASPWATRSARSGRTASSSPSPAATAARLSIGSDMHPLDFAEHAHQLDDPRVFGAGLHARPPVLEVELAEPLRPARPEAAAGEDDLHLPRFRLVALVEVDR